MTATRSPLVMTPGERRALLAGVHAGIVVAARGAGRAPLATPVWYAPEDDDGVVFVTSRHSRKAALVTDGDRIGFLVQDETPPQRFVTLEGDASVAVATDDVRRRIARRYLPPDAVDGFVAMTPSAELVAVTIRPAIWFSSDFAKLAPGAPSDGES